MIKLNGFESKADLLKISFYPRFEAHFVRDKDIYFTINENAQILTLDDYKRDLLLDKSSELPSVVAKLY